jgi:predicted dienelactone hydrolase
MLPLRRAPLAFLLTLVALTLAASPGWAGAGAPPDPAALGPFAVGHEAFQALDAARPETFAGQFGPRKLAVDVWYPADPGQGGGSLSRYSLQVFTLGFNSTVARDGLSPIPRVARPLIVFSHGSGGISTQSTGLCEALASHGFVVVAPNHTGNTAEDVFKGRSLPFEQTVRNRPRDISFLIDRMIARSRDRLDPFYRVINPFQIGVAGHSFGGFTTLAMAAGHGDFAADPRVRAIFPIAPAARILTDAELARIKVPTFVLGGTLDSTTPIEPNSRITFEEPSSRRVYRADIKNATHTHFASICKLAQVLLDLDQPLSFIISVVPGYLETCSAGAFPIAEAERIQNLYAVSFFRRHLLQDGRYETFLTQPYAQTMEPNVDYRRRIPTLPVFFQAFLDALARPTPN